MNAAMPRTRNAFIFMVSVRMVRLAWDRTDRWRSDQQAGKRPSVAHRAIASAAGPGKPLSRPPASFEQIMAMFTARAIQAGTLG